VFAWEPHFGLLHKFFWTSHEFGPNGVAPGQLRVFQGDGLDIVALTGYRLSMSVREVRARDKFAAALQAVVHCMLRNDAALPFAMSPCLVAMVGVSVNVFRYANRLARFLALLIPAQLISVPFMNFCASQRMR
jgi:hypothetical protein